MGRLDLKESDLRIKIGNNGQYQGAVHPPSKLLCDYLGNKFFCLFYILFNYHKLLGFYYVFRTAEEYIIPNTQVGP